MLPQSKRLCMTSCRGLEDVKASCAGIHANLSSGLSKTLQDHRWCRVRGRTHTLNHLPGTKWLSSTPKLVIWCKSRGRQKHRMKPSCSDDAACGRFWKPNCCPELHQLVMNQCMATKTWKMPQSKDTTQRETTKHTPVTRKAKQLKKSLSKHATERIQHNLSCPMRSLGSLKLLGCALVVQKFARHLLCSGPWLEMM